MRLIIIAKTVLLSAAIIMMVGGLFTVSSLAKKQI